MKSFLQLRYHLLLLGLAVVAAVASIVFLLGKSEEFHNSLTGSPVSGKSLSYTETNRVSNSVASLELLKKGCRWDPRTDGASPFVSRPYLLKEGQLLDPMASDSPLHPPVPNNWLIDHHLDYTDMNILERDPKHKGFTILEEFQAGTDPNNPDEFPPLCAKLSFDESGISKTSYLLEFLGEDESNGRREFLIKPVTSLPNPSKGGRPDTSTRGVVKGETIPGADFLKVVDYRELPKKVINDTEYDANELVLENTLTKERIALIPKNSSREYKAQLKPIDLIKSVALRYQLAGGPEEFITVDRGNEFTLSSLNKSHSESFKLIDISKNGVLLQQKDGKNFTVKSTAGKQATPPPVQ